MIVTFCGHRDFVKTDTTEQILTALLERYAQENDELICYCGGCGNFDGFAAECVRQLKERYQNIRSYLILPYTNPEYLERLGVMKKILRRYHLSAFGERAKKIRHYPPQRMDC